MTPVYFSIRDIAENCRVTRFLYVLERVSTKKPPSDGL